LPARSTAPSTTVRESEIGRGFVRAALRNERGGLRARLVIEASDWGAMRGQTSFDNVDELFALGLSSVALDDYSRARAAAGELRTAAAATPEPDAADIIKIMGDQVDGLLAIADGDPTQGLALLARSAQREYARPAPAARPFPAKPAGELYAEALAGLGQPAAAVREYQRVLARTPNRALALLGLARAARAAGDLPEARRAARAFLAIWHAADAERPELGEARALAR
jgi:tetratricopeptide (TPR) repeat protein